IRRRWLVTRSGYASVLRESGNLEETIPIFEQNLKDTQTALQDAPNDLKLNRFEAIAYGDYSLSMYANNEIEKALELILKSQEISRRLSNETPNDMDLFRNFGVSCEGVGRFASYLGKNELAETNAKENVQI